LACCNHAYGNDDVKGKTVAVQGIGNVGYALCEHLHKNGAKLIVADIDEERVNRAVKELGATKVDMDKIYSVDCDIYAPCALGASVNDETIPQFKCKIICGAANNVLKDAPVHGKALQSKGIVYAPDYVANAGGVINVSYELVEGGYNEEASLRSINQLYYRMSDVLRISKETGKPTYEVADNMAEARIEAVKNIKGIYLKSNK
jgi:leucine dehydrogenase